MLFAKPVKKETVFRKEKDVKFRTGDFSSSLMAAKKQFKRTDPEFQDKLVDNKSTLFRFAKEKFGVELAMDTNDKKPAAAKPSGKGFSPKKGSSRRGNTKSWTVTVWTLHP